MKISHWRELYDLKDCKQAHKWTGGQTGTVYWKRRATKHRRRQDSAYIAEGFED